MGDKIVVSPITIEYFLTFSNFQSSFPVFLTIFHHSIVRVSVWKYDLALSVWIIISKFTFVSQIKGCLQDAHTHAHALVKLSLVDRSICPGISSFTIRRIIFVNSFITISVYEVFPSKAMLSICKEGSFVLPSCLGVMSTLDDKASNALCLPAAPFAIVALSSRVYPKTLSMLGVLEPIADIHFTVQPLELSFAFSAVIIETALIDSLLYYLYSFYFIVTLPESLEVGIMCKKDTFTTTDFTDHLANIDFVFAELD